MRRGLAIALALVWLGLGLGIRRDDWKLVPYVALAVVFGALLLVPRAFVAIERAILAPSWRVFVALACAIAFGLSMYVVRGPLHDRTLAIDASVYLMQARALAHGSFGMPNAPPLLHASGRFLLEGPDARIYGIFPPGYPLFLVPFVSFGLPLLSGPLLAVLLVLAQSKLASRLGGSDLARRLALLFSLSSFARAMETSDLLSHALVALLFVLVVVLVLGDERPWKSIALGACLGLAICSRLLDGAFLAVIVFAVLAWKKRFRTLALSIGGALPFLVLLALEQRAVTGGWHLTQSVYFTRSDWPPDCHALGFGKNIGCNVEHAFWMPEMGNDGYGLDDCVRVLRERGVRLWKDLFGVPILGLLVVTLAVKKHRVRDVVGVAFVIAFSLAYGLFYFGNVPFYGARHLFPIAPLAWILGARAASEIRFRGSKLAAPALACCIAGQIPIWRTETSAVSAYQADRSDLRRAAARDHLDNAIVRSSDGIAVIAAFDSIEDGNRVLFVKDDKSGLLDLRRTYPDHAVYIAPRGDELAKLMLGPPGPGIHVEIESAWPTFQRPKDVLARPMDVTYWDLPEKSASGKAVMMLAHARGGSTLEVPFTLASAITSVLRFDFIAGPKFGVWDVAIDNKVLAQVDGYAPSPERRSIQLGELTLSASRHALFFLCTGKNERSDGFDAAFDALVSVP